MFYFIRWRCGEDGNVGGSGEWIVAELQRGWAVVDRMGVVGDGGRLEAVVRG